MALKKTIKVGIGLISWVTLCNCVKTLDNPYRFSPYEQSHSLDRERSVARGQKISDFEAKRENDKFLYKYSKVCNRCLMGSTDQADPSCFYFRISGILTERH